MTSSADQASGQTPSFTRGELAYLQLPAADVVRSAGFYETLFGWRVERGKSGFEAPGLIGQWVEDRPPAPDAGPLLWLNVDDVDAALELARALDGEVVSEPEADGPVRVLATIHDPAGNTLGLVQHTGGA